MSRSSDRGAVEPIAALVAVFAVSVGLALYAGVVEDALATAGGTQNRAAPTADAVERRLASAGVVHPERIENASLAIPAGYEGNVTLRTGSTWTTGPTPPPRADTATRLVSVRVGLGTIERGSLSVRVWR
jgi:hypothetical protein